MTILVNLAADRTVCFNVREANARQLKEFIQTREAIPLLEQRLIFNGRDLGDADILQSGTSAFAFTNGSQFHVQVNWLSLN